MADVGVTLGIDAQELYKELQNVTARFVQFSQTVEKAGNVPNFGQPIVEGHENVLRSSHRVASQIESFSRTLLASSNPIQVFASGLSGLERSFNLSLGSLAAIGIGATLVHEIAQGVAEYKKLNAEVDRLSEPRPSAQFQSLKEIETQAGATQKVLEKLREKQSAEGITGGGLISDLIAAGTIGGSKGLTEGFASLIHDVREKRRGQIAGLEEQEGISQTERVEKEQKKTEIADAHLNRGEFASDRIKINAEFDEKVGAAAGTTGARGVVELDKQRAIALAEVDKKEQEQKKKEEEKDARKLDSLREKVGKGERAEELAALPAEQRIQELQKQSGFLKKAADSATDEEEGLKTKEQYLQITKQLHAEEKQLSDEKDRQAKKDEAEKERADRAAAQNSAALASAKETTEQMQLRAEGDKLGAEQAGIRAKYEKEIAAALDRKNPNEPLAEELKKQEGIALHEANVREASKSPAERQQDERNRLEQAQKRNLAEAIAKDEEDRRARGAYDQSSGGPKGDTAIRDARGNITGYKRGERPEGLTTTGLGPTLSDAAFHDQFKQKGLKLDTSDADFHKQFEPRGLTRADQVKQGAVGKDSDKEKHLPVAEKQLTALEKIEKNTADMGKNK